MERDFAVSLCNIESSRVSPTLISRFREETIYSLCKRERTVTKSNVWGMQDQQDN
ncbi:hypothetical protein BDR04DRAFT_1105378 [Suillus decipiens]|nr:hypothetical protein BDR04DRAFT_1105378 [Suillus decipiens]